jgi:hypothetical protein
MSQRLPLLKRLQDVNLSPEEAEGLLQRVQNNHASAEDRDRLAQVIRTTTQVADELLKASTWREEAGSHHPAPARQAKRKRQLAKAARRRNRR